MITTVLNFAMVAVNLLLYFEMGAHWWNVIGAVVCAVCAGLTWGVWMTRRWYSR